MKAFKKAAALLMAIVMVLGLSVTAFATEETVTYGDTAHPVVQDKQGNDLAATTDAKITISNAQPGRTYHLWQIFKMELTAKTDASGNLVKDAYGNQVYVPVYKTQDGTDNLVLDGDFAIPNPNFDPNQPADPATNPETINAQYDAPNPSFDPNQPADPVTNPETIKKNGIDGGKWFNVDGGIVTAKEEGGVKHPTEAELKSPEFKAWAKAYGVKVISGTPTDRIVNNNTQNDDFHFAKVPYGYYMIEVDPSSTDNTTDPTTNPFFRGVVTVDSTMPTATVADKNDPPHWDDEYGKEITSDNGKSTTQPNIGSVALGESVDYKLDIASRTVNNETGKEIYRYTFIDSIAKGMTYMNDAAHPFILDVGDPATSNYTKIENWHVVDPTNTATYPYNDSTNHAANHAFITYFKVPYTDIRTHMEDSANQAAITAVGSTWEYMIKTFGTTNIAEAQSFRVDIPWADYTTDSNGIADVVDGSAYYTDGIQLTLRYTAFLDPTKVEDENFTNPNENMAMFLWYEEGDKDDDYEPRNPDEIPVEQKAYVFSTQLIVKKVDENGNVLTGAKFTLTGPTGQTFVTKRITSFALWAKDDAKTAEINDGIDYDADGIPNDTTNARYLATYKYWKLANGNYTDKDPDTLRSDYDASVHTEETDETSPNYKYAYKRSLYAAPLTDRYKGIETATAPTQSGGTYPNAVEETVDAAGEATFQGLGEHTYTLVETGVPAGYNKAADISFTVSMDPASNETTWTFESDNTDVTWDSNLKAFLVTVENNQGTELPQTGGIGTTIFVVGGSILMVAAGIILFTRKRTGYAD